MTVPTDKRVAINGEEIQTDRLEFLLTRFIYYWDSVSHQTVAMIITDIDTQTVYVAAQPVPTRNPNPIATFKVLRTEMKYTIEALF